MERSRLRTRSKDARRRWQGRKRSFRAPLLHFFVSHDCLFKPPTRLAIAHLLATIP